MSKKNRKSGLSTALGIGLAILLFSLLHLGLNAFYEQPNYEDYCNRTNLPNPTDKLSCESQGGMWYDNSQDPLNKGYCDMYFTCNQEYQKALDDYNNIVFYIFVIVGLAISIYGFYIKKKTFQITAISAGLAFIIEGIVRNYQNKIPAFIAGLIAFVILAYFINKRFVK